DVREDFEHAGERIAGSHHAALSRFDEQGLSGAHGDKRVVFYCRTGRRSEDAATRYAATGQPGFHLAGGIEGWKAAGRPTQKPAGGPRLDVMRQVQVTAGSMVLLGVVLGITVSPYFLILSGFVGAGLVFAGLSGWCGMAMLLSRMPWNRTTGPATSCSR
ncbi:MAG: rhodanese family protein, partial [Phycisphaerales bacterium]|nr:rhodanese family protein [Phycisphaerales bacterium]